MRFNNIKQAWLVYWTDQLKNFKTGDGSYYEIYECRHQAAIRAFIDANRDNLTTDEMQCFKENVYYIEDYEPETMEYNNTAMDPETFARHIANEE